MSAMIELLPAKLIVNVGSTLLQSRVKRALPFIESPRGEYTHRVKSAKSFTQTTSSVYWKAGDIHIAAHCWCGMTLLLSARKPSRFVAEPSPGRPICATCEGRAIGAGMLGAPEIAGRAVKFSPQRVTA